MWIINYLDDIDADFRVFYRIDGIADGEFGDLSAKRFVALCERLGNYQGSMVAEVRRQHEEQQAKLQQAENGEGYDSGEEEEERFVGDFTSDLEEALDEEQDLSGLGLNMETL